MQSNKIKHKIFELFIANRRLRFSEIEKAIGIKSNTLAYHLENLVKEGLLKKDEDDYVLTVQGEGRIPFHAQQQEIGVLPVVLGAILNKNQILMLKRKKRPYQGYWALPGGKLKLAETIPESAIRHAKEETGLDCEFSHIASIIHERVKETETYKHAFIIFLTVLKPKNTQIKESEEGKLEWFPLKSLQPERIIPSDYQMLKHLTEKAKLTSIILEEKEEKIIKFSQTKI